jgi:hypothetical protein
LLTVSQFLEETHMGHGGFFPNPSPHTAAEVLLTQHLADLGTCDMALYIEACSGPEDNAFDNLTTSGFFLLLLCFIMIVRPSQRQLILLLNCP